MMIRQCAICFCVFSILGASLAHGQGRSDQRFVSDSGRIVIEPENWDVAYAPALANVKPIPDQFVVRLQVVPHCTDTVAPIASLDPSIETVVTVAQRLARLSHTLEISGKADRPVTAVRVYRPALETTSE